MACFSPVSDIPVSIDFFLKGHGVELGRRGYILTTIVLVLYLSLICREELIFIPLAQKLCVSLMAFGRKNNTLIDNYYSDYY